MKRLFIIKENLKILVKNLKKECDEFIAPKREHLDDIIFGDTKVDGGELLEYEGNSVISPRAFLLPQSEPLFEIKSARESDLVPIQDKKRRIFYGVRPCDIKALALMRRFFLDAVVDVPYQEKMEHSIFIALACNTLCSAEAFCCELDAGPVAQEGFDLQLVAGENGFLVDVGTKKGKHIVEGHKTLFTNAPARDAKQANALFKDMAKGCRRIDYKKVAQAMRDNKVAESVWDDIALRCVVCSGCTTLCPTCSCFRVVDRLSHGKGVRLRYCDGCPYAGFTRMAGDNAPLPLHKDHIRRFFEHKLNVDVARYGAPSCVGCARCIRTCPGNISIRKFIEAVAGQTKAE